MSLKSYLVVVVVVVAGLLVACASTPQSKPTSDGSISGPAASPDGASGGAVDVPGTESPAGSTRLAPGLYDLGYGRAQAVGQLEYRDLEGGFWAIVGGTEAEGTVGTVVAVIANPEKFSHTLQQMKGQSVIATGLKVDGASIRMSGPEIELTEIEATSNTVAPNE